MNRQDLRDAAVARRTNGVPETRVAWRCEFCLRDFQTENGFMRHFCQQRQKLDELKTPLGQAAYDYYGQWMRLQKRSVPPAETFLSSRQHNNFMRFAEWAAKTSIPNVNQFIKLMVESSTQPVLWCRNATYSLYLQWYDNAYPPREQFIETYDKLVQLAAGHAVPINAVYKTVGVNEIIKLIRQRKLSPWLLVLSPNFLGWVQTLEQFERDALNEAINFGAFAAKLNDNIQLSKELRQVCEAENI